jgi:hypothetical protein
MSTRRKPLSHAANEHTGRRSPHKPDHRRTAKPKKHTKHTSNHERKH